MAAGGRRLAAQPSSRKVVRLREGVTRGAALASLLLIAAADFQPCGAEPTAGTTADWPYYGGDAGGSHYSPLTQIDRSNVAQLKIAWEYHTGDVSDGSDNRQKSEFETTPIVATPPIPKVSSIAASHCGSILRKPRAIPAIGASFWRPSMRGFSPSMPRRGNSAKISAPQVKST